MIFDKVLTGTQSKSADNYAINIMQIPSLELMSNASRCVAEEIVGILQDRGKVAIFSGVGNNGADGLNIARILICNGYDVKTFICGNRDKASSEFIYQLEKLETLQGEIFWYTDENAGIVLSSLNSFMPSVIVDAIFGIGLYRNIVGTFAKFIDEINRYLSSAALHLSPVEIVAVDIPSGINADNGQFMAKGIRADITVTFGCNKTGLLTGAGPEYAGQIIVKDIGIPKEAYESC